jgi:DNA-binding transcriptional LysR family regulator
VADYHHHEALHAIAVHQAINSAARTLGITSSALGKRLKAFERDTNLTLFHRHTGSGENVLTREGMQVARISARIVQVSAEVDAALAAMISELKTNHRKLSDQF